MNNETEQPDAIDRITIDKRAMLALEKIAVALEKLNLDKYKTTKQYGSITKLGTRDQGTQQRIKKIALGVTPTG